jgi:hypothetical protein
LVLGHAARHANDRRIEVICAELIDDVHSVCASIQKIIWSLWRRDTGGRKPFGERAKTVSACAGQSVGHDDDRSRPFFRRHGVEPRSTSIMAGGER